MIQVHSKARNQTIEIDRIIGQLKSNKPGPTLIFFAGIHGNETAGVFALNDVMKELSQNHGIEKGSVYALSGNLKALSNQVRYLHKDLNRMWTGQYINGHHHKTDEQNVEYEEMESLREQVNNILHQERGPFYFFDLHTTSSDSPPFITINDTLVNRKFALHFDLPVILGVEEYLDGPLLSYINTLGYISIGFESGQHDDIRSIEVHKEFIIQSLVITGLIKAGSKGMPSAQLSDHIFYEIVYRHAVVNSTFDMCPGFSNFQPIVKGEILASYNEEWITACEDGFIFMPLYQQQGDDGYFIIQPIQKMYLRLSSLLRRIRLDSILALLPGIRYTDSSHTTLHVNQRVARYFAKDFLHLLGYRVKQHDALHLVAHKREQRRARKYYRNEPWLN